MESFDWIYPILFYVLGGLALFTAIFLVCAKTPLYSTLSLLATFLMISTLYILLNAQLIALVNVVVYAGAIMVLFIFVLMLINEAQKISPSVQYAARRSFKILGIFGSVGILVLLLNMFLGGVYWSSDTTADLLYAQTDVGLVRNLGRALFTTYSLPFELTGVLFMVALMGTVILGKK